MHAHSRSNVCVTTFLVIEFNSSPLQWIIRFFYPLEKLRKSSDNFYSFDWQFLRDFCYRKVESTIGSSVNATINLYLTGPKCNININIKSIFTIVIDAFKNISCSTVRVRKTLYNGIERCTFRNHFE